MKKIRFIYWLVVLALSITPILSPDNTGYAQTTPPQVVLEDPSITPAYAGMCDSYWNRFTNERGHYAYLTLNTNQPAGSTNYASWNTKLPQEGVYLVEAFIPAHGPIDWECPTKTIETDTLEARYTITHGFGVSTAIRPQATSGGKWLSLGEYFFRPTITATVSLVDLNKEENLSRTISFSAVRFTWLRSVPFISRLPMAMHNGGSAVKAQTAWTASTSGAVRNAFLPGEVIRLYAGGTNTTGSPSLAHLTWKQQGPCGASTVYSTTLSMPAANWTNFYTLTLPACTGLYTYTLELNHVGYISTASAPFLVNQPSTTPLTTKPAFDKCTIPTISEMQTWWNKSPYRVINLYFGGISRSCSNLALDSFWVSQASKQGWSFIPTWVGPQAPCTAFPHRLNADPALAFLDGRSEADAAYTAARKIGLLGDQVLYYDMEGFNANSTANCRNAVKSFVNGWTGRLHELGVQAAMYGGSCSSFMTDWLTIPNIPDDVWVAAWYQPYKYDPNAGVYDVKCLPTNVWTDNQRLRQYTGGHTETWGGLSMSIDSSATDGEVNALPMQAPGPQAPASLLDATPTPGSASTSAFQLLPSGQGWALMDGQLLWSANGGQQWRNITPALDNDEFISGGDFIDELQGWLVSTSLDNGIVNIFHTVNGGTSWQSTRINTKGLSSIPANGQVDFFDSQHGWLAITLQSSSNFSLGVLYRTLDGGETWQRLALPSAGRISFSTANQGWLLGGPSGDELYQTQDGGLTWTREAPESLDIQPDRSFPDRNENNLPAALPEGVIQVQFAANGTGWALATAGQCQGDKSSGGWQCSQTTRLYITTDGGLTWK